MISGDVLPWRDPMHHGPFSTGLPLDEVSKLRAQYLVGPKGDAPTAEQDFMLRNDLLRAGSNYDRIILWFEHDLLDQLQILQILDALSGMMLGNTEMQMICINAFQGIEPFRGIGQLDKDQMASLFDLKETVTSQQLALAKAGWSAFCSSDPRDLERYISRDLSPLPFLKAALLRHLEEYPSLQTGLSRTQTQILQLVASGMSDPVEIFTANMNLENELFMGDWPTYSHIDELCTAKQPLLQTKTGEAFWHPAEIHHTQNEFRTQHLELTQAGKQVLSNDKDAFEFLEIDRWLGGVHLLSGQPIWTWNAQDNSLELREI